MFQKEQSCQQSHVGKKHRKVPISSGNMEGLGGQDQSQVSGVATRQPPVEE